MVCSVDSKTRNKESSQSVHWISQLAFGLDVTQLLGCSLFCYPVCKSKQMNVNVFHLAVLQSPLKYAVVNTAVQ